MLLSYRQRYNFSSQWKVTPNQTFHLVFCYSAFGFDVQEWEASCKEGRAKSHDVSPHVDLAGDLSFSSFFLKLWKMPVVSQDHPWLPHHPLHVGGLSVLGNRTAWFSSQPGLSWPSSRLISVFLITQPSEIYCGKINQPTNCLSRLITNCINISFLTNVTNNPLVIYSLSPLSKITPVFFYKHHDCAGICLQLFTSRETKTQGGGVIYSRSLGNVGTGNWGLGSWNWCLPLLVSIMWEGELLFKTERDAAYIRRIQLHSAPFLSQRLEGDRKERSYFRTYFYSLSLGPGVNCPELGRAQK